MLVNQYSISPKNHVKPGALWKNHDAHKPQNKSNLCSVFPIQEVIDVNKTTGCQKSAARGFVWLELKC
jgi:hypothetical protein